MANVSATRRASAIANVFAFHVDERVIKRSDSMHEAESEPLRRVFCQGLTEQLAALKIPPAALQVLALAPLAYAAWANGTLTSSKRDLALKAACLKGIAKDSISYQILENWLNHRPDPTLIIVWHDYVGALKWILSDESLTLLQQTILERARAILRATSNSFGIRNFSENDQAVLEKLRSAF